MNPQILNVVFEDGIDSEAILNLKSELATFEDSVEFYETPDKGPQASIILLTMSSIALVFGAAFVKKLGDKAAEDCYPIIKKSLQTIYKKYFGEGAEYECQIITSSQSSKKVPETDYSLVLALYCVGKNNERVKLLYKTNWEQSQFEKATDIYLSSITKFVNSGAGEVQDLIDKSPNSMQPALIAWDEISDKLIKINPMPRSIGI
ncbi:hypothetical protein [Pseudoalteromonas sp. T1lg23B]|uniref:hypothetical protein n=1 Tax=Pseudoalteromonas sp. T1lg23B TaxID=2077097 RepID=UPI000CF6CB01|nr:hypothetical protein [Pseudoalteromonas sp. T1lg23B]